MNLVITLCWGELLREIPNGMEKSIFSILRETSVTGWRLVCASFIYWCTKRISGAWHALYLFSEETSSLLLSLIEININLLWSLFVRKAVQVNLFHILISISSFCLLCSYEQRLRDSTWRLGLIIFNTLLSCRGLLQHPRTFTILHLHKRKH